MQYSGGLNLRFFEDSAPKTPLRQAFSLLTEGHKPDVLSELISWTFIKAIFFKKNPILLAEAFRLLQEGFTNIHRILAAEENLSQDALIQAQFTIANALSLIPYMEPTTNQSITIPQYINNTWTPVNYSFDKIELTPKEGFEAFFVQPKDKVFAYGLRPLNNEDAHPHLIFMGTTYPKGQGFHSTLYSDFEAFTTPGEYLYRHSRGTLGQWLDAQPKKAYVTGASLGGSLGLLLAIDQGEKIARVDALNPPGLYPSVFKSAFDRWDNILTKPSVFIQKQAEDPVSSFGKWKADWEMFRVHAPENRAAPNMFAAHAMHYAAMAETRFERLDPKKESKEYPMRNLFLYGLLRSAFFYLLFVPYHYAIRPMIHIISLIPGLVIRAIQAAQNEENNNVVPQHYEALAAAMR